MPLIKYMGPFAEGVHLPALGLDVKRNHQIEVDKETFESLIGQDGWVAVEHKPSKKPGAKKPKAKKPAQPVAESGPELVDVPADTNIIPAEPADPIEGDKS